MRVGQGRRYAVAAALMIGSAAVAAQAIDARGCDTVVAAEARLACYDKAFPPTAQVQAAQAEQRLDAFGRAPERRDPKDVPPQLTATVTALDYRADGTRTLELDNGQQWLLSEGGSHGHLAEGDTVTVRRGAMGGYLLRTASGVMLRARRLR